MLGAGAAGAAAARSPGAAGAARTPRKARRRRRRRRRPRRADRRAGADEGRQVGDRARGARPRRRPRPQPRPRRRQGLRARRHVRRPDPGPHHRARPRRYGVGTFDTTTRATTSTHRGRPARRSRTRARPARRRRTRRSSPDLALVVTRLDAMSLEVPVDAPWEAAQGRASTTARRSRPGSTPTRVNAAASARWSRRRRGRSSAPSRASCRCCSSSSTSPPRATRRNAGHVRAQLQHARRARRSRASSAARSVIPLRWRASSASASCCARPCGGSTQAKGGVRGRVRPRRSSRPST